MAHRIIQAEFKPTMKALGKVTSAVQVGDYLSYQEALQSFDEEFQKVEDSLPKRDWLRNRIELLLNASTTAFTSSYDVSTRNWARDEALDIYLAFPTPCDI